MTKHSEQTIRNRMRLLAAIVAVAVVAGVAVAPAAADNYAASGRCTQEIGLIPGTGVGQPAGITVEVAPWVSAVNETTLLDSQTVTRSLYLYWWNGTSWIYSGTHHESETYVQESTFAAYGLGNQTTNAFVSKPGYGGDLPLLPFPTFGYYYAVKQQLVWRSDRTGQTVRSSWTGLNLAVLDFDSSWRWYCSYR